MYQESAHGQCTSHGVQKGRFGAMPNKKTSGTTWVLPIDAQGVPAHQLFRGTFREEGRLEMARGSLPTFNPETAMYATSDMVTNICANAGIAIYGDIASSRRFLAQEHTWKRMMTLDELIAHPWLGKTMPTRETIIAAYAQDEEVEA